jgi:hypothetical protein
MGLSAAILLAVACFLPWVYIHSLGEVFTGFHVKEFPNGTYYGKAGNIILPVTLAVIVFMLIPKIWAKRANLFLTAFLLAFSIRTYIIFTSSLFEGEVEKKIGIYLVLFLPIILLISSVFPKGGSKIPDDVIQRNKSAFDSK